MVFFQFGYEQITQNGICSRIASTWYKSTQIVFHFVQSSSIPFKHIHFVWHRTGRIPLVAEIQSMPVQHIFMHTHIRTHQHTSTTWCPYTVTSTIGHISRHQNPNNPKCQSYKLNLLQTHVRFTVAKIVCGLLLSQLLLLLCWISVSYQTTGWGGRGSASNHSVAIVHITILVLLCA